MLSLFIKFAAWWELSAQRFPIFPSQWSRRTCGGPVAQVYMECVRASRCFPDQKKRLLGFLASSSLTPRFPPDLLVGVCSPPEFEARGARIVVRSEVNRVSIPSALARLRTLAPNIPVVVVIFSPVFYWLSIFLLTTSFQARKPGQCSSGSLAPNTHTETKRKLEWRDTDR